MRTFALTVAYDGTDWAGFQRLRDRPTVQGQLETALAALLGHEVRIAAAGRTDAGVHALGQVISLRTENPIPIERIPRAMNRLLPESIRVRKAMERQDGFHARRSAIRRWYRYLVQPERQPDPICGRFCWQMPESLNRNAMQETLNPLLGRQDFSTFCHSEIPAGGAIRTLYAVRVGCWSAGVLIDIQADAFVHRMVRLLVANAVLVGCGARPVTWLEELLHARCRSLAGPGAPPHGLFLMRIGYPPSNASSSPVEDEVGEGNHEIISG